MCTQEVEEETRYWIRMKISNFIDILVIKYIDISMKNENFEKY